MNKIPDEKQLMTQITMLGGGVSDSLAVLHVRLKSLKAIRDRIEERKKEITGPLWKAYKSAQDLFRPLEDAAEMADAQLRKHILLLEEKREKEEAKLVKRVEKGNVSVDESLSLMVNKEKGLFRTIQKLKIISKAKIPDKYWVIDEVALRAALIAGKKVPGAILIEEKTVIAR